MNIKSLNYYEYDGKKKIALVESGTVSLDVTAQVPSYVRTEYLYRSSIKQSTFLMYGRFPDRESK